MNANTMDKRKILIHFETFSFEKSIIVEKQIVIG